MNDPRKIGAVVVVAILLITMISPIMTAVSGSSLTKESTVLSALIIIMLSLIAYYLVKHND